MGRVAFRPARGYERVVLHLRRIGSGGDPATISASAVRSSRLGEAVRGVRTPRGRSTISLVLSGGVDGNLGVRGYRPKGLAHLTEFSVYPAARGGSRVLISTDTDGCFRVRVPAWSAGGSAARKTTVYVDVRTSPPTTRS